MGWRLHPRAAWERVCLTGESAFLAMMEGMVKLCRQGRRVVLVSINDKTGTAMKDG
jgi:hypothetical protein